MPANRTSHSSPKDDDFFAPGDPLSPKQKSAIHSVQHCLRAMRNTRIVRMHRTDESFVKPFCESLLLPLDLRALALGRVALGLLSVWHIIEQWAEREYWLLDGGICPRTSVMARSLDTFSLYWMVGKEPAVSCLLAVHLLVCLCFTVGYRTASAGALLWALHHSLKVKNWCHSYGGDVALVQWSFWCMFVPLGHVWSLDSALRRGRPGPSAAPDAAGASGENAPPKRDGDAAAAPSTRGDGTAAGKAEVPPPALPGAVRHDLQWHGYILILHLSMVYYSTGCTKLGSEYTQGTAVRTVLRTAFARDPVAGVLLRFPALLRVSGAAVVWLEYLGWLGFFVPLQSVRLVAVGAFVLMHLSLHAALDAHHFQWVMICGLACLLPPCAMARLERPCGRAAQWVARTLGGPGRAVLEGLRGTGPPSESAGGGGLLPDAVGARLRVARSAALWLFVWFSMVTSTCDTIARVARRYGRSYLCPPLHPPRWIGDVVSALRLKYTYTMYAPEPVLPRWKTIPALLANGEVRELLLDGRLDLRQRGPPRRYNETAVLPPRRRPAYPFRLWKFLTDHFEGLEGRFGGYVCRAWDRGHDRQQALAGFVVVGLYLQRRDVGLAVPPVQRYVQYVHWCKGVYNGTMQEHRFIDLKKYRWPAAPPNPR